jgi:hypothetical protein
MKHFLEQPITGNQVYILSTSKTLILCRVVKMSTTVKADTAILDFATKTYHASFEKLKGVENLLFSVTLESIPVSMMQASLARGGNSLGLNPSDGPLVVILFYTSWNSPDDDYLVYEVNKQALRDIESESENKGVASSFRYMNYSFTHQDPIAGYGLQSQAHLRAASAKYDPDGFFQASNSGAFKLGR